MRSIPRLLSAAIAAGALAASSAVSMHAHPGHDHGDIPSLIRHPFAGPEHLLGSISVGLALAGALHLATRRLPVPALARWTGLGVVAIVVTWTAGIAT